MNKLIRRALPLEHKILSEITRNSKAHWGYSVEQLKLWEGDLTISAEYIEQNDCFVFLLDDKPMGYYSYFAIGDRQVELDNLFVHPDFIGKGFGRLLMDDFLNRVKEEPFQSIILYSDPHAEKFYDHYGFKIIGKKETSIPGRFLPVMELKV